LAEVEPLGDVEEIEFTGVGKLEAFYSDGLRTLLHTVKSAKNMAEKTLRYPGHIEKIRLLKDMGFFEEKPVQVEKVSIPPKSVAVKLLERKLKRPEVPDIPTKRIKFVGNAAGAGSRMVLISRELRRTAAAISRKSGYVELATEPDFQSEFAMAMFFPHRDLGRFPSFNKLV